MAARRLILVMLVLLVASSILAALVPVEPNRGGDESSSSTTTTEAAEPRPAGELVRRTIAADDPTPERIELELGDQLDLTVTSAKLADQVEIPAFGGLDEVDPDFPARFDLLAARAGQLPGPPGRGRAGDRADRGRRREARSGRIARATTEPGGSGEPGGADSSGEPGSSSDSPGSSTGDLDLGRQLAHLSGEPPRRPVEELARPPAHVAADQRPPVDRDHRPRPDPGRRLGRACAD